MTQIPGNNVYSQNSGSSTNNPFITVFETRDPTPYDFNYPVQKRWINTVDETEYVLVSFSSTPTATLANWALIGTGGISIHTVTGNSGGAVGPDDDGNVNIVGDETTINIIGMPITDINPTPSLTVSVKLPSTAHQVLLGQTSSITGIAPSSIVGTPLCSAGTSSDPIYDTSPVVDSITINNAPIQPTDGTNKAYVDLIASGLNFVNTCYASSTANLNATYNNGAAGVGATLTNAGTLAAFTTDGTSPALNARILVQFQTDQTQNGVYGLTTIGSGAVAWVLTRTADYDTPAEIQPGDIVPVSNGTLYADTLWIQTEVVTTIGTDPINFNQFGANKTLQVNIQTPSVSYNPSSSVVACIVELCGGGGGGGGAAGGSGQSAAGGGGAGGYSRRSFLYSDLSPSLPIAITIGAGGNGGSAGNNSGSAGGTTDFGGIFSATGGGGGAGSALNPGGITAGGGGGPGGSGVGGNINTSGNYGTNGLLINVSGQGTLIVGGAGGSSYFSGAAPSNILSGVGQSAGAAATSYGNGGGGGVVDMGSSVAGGDGFDGICIITEYILV